MHRYRYELEHCRAPDASVTATVELNAHSLAHARELLHDLLVREEDLLGAEGVPDGEPGLTRLAVRFYASAISVYDLVAIDGESLDGYHAIATLAAIADSVEHNRLEDVVGEWRVEVEENARVDAADLADIADAIHRRHFVSAPDAPFRWELHLPPALVAFNHFKPASTV